MGRKTKHHESEAKLWVEWKGGTSNFAWAGDMERLFWADMQKTSNLFLDLQNNLV